MDNKNFQRRLIAASKRYGNLLLPGSAALQPAAKSHGDDSNHTPSASNCILVTILWAAILALWIFHSLVSGNENFLDSSTITFLLGNPNSAFDPKFQPFMHLIVSLGAAIGVGSLVANMISYKIIGPTAATPAPAEGETQPVVSQSHSRENTVDVQIESKIKLVTALVISPAISALVVGYFWVSIFLVYPWRCVSLTQPYCLTTPVWLALYGYAIPKIAYIILLTIGWTFTQIILLNRRLIVCKQKLDFLLNKLLRCSPNEKDDKNDQNLSRCRKLSPRPKIHSHLYLVKLFHSITTEWNFGLNENLTATKTGGTVNLLLLINLTLTLMILPGVFLCFFSLYAFLFKNTDNKQQLVFITNLITSQSFFYSLAMLAGLLLPAAHLAWTARRFENSSAAAIARLVEIFHRDMYVNEVFLPQISPLRIFKYLNAIIIATNETHRNINNSGVTVKILGNALTVSYESLAVVLLEMSTYFLLLVTVMNQ